MMALRTTISMRAREERAAVPESALPRMLILVGKQARVQDYAVPEGDATRPRVEYALLGEALEAEILTLCDAAQSAHPLVRAAYRRSPEAALALLGFLRRSEVDGFYISAEDIAIYLAMLMVPSGRPGTITTVVHNCDTPKRRQLFRLLGNRGFRSLICLAAQQEAVLREVGVRPERIEMIYNWIDDAFFDPAAVPRQANQGMYVFACGMENRDYPTLMAAAEQAGLPVSVVASGWSPQPGYADASGIAETEKVRVEGRLSFAELRQRYAAARFVVLPLAPAPYAAGVTGALEAMAMGKAIVWSESPGLADYLRPDESGLVVPPGDPGALAAAMLRLWHDPELCERMGRRNRAWVEENASMSKYVERVVAVLAVGGDDPERRLGS